MGRLALKRLVYGAMRRTHVHRIFGCLAPSRGAFLMFHRVVEELPEAGFHPSLQFMLRAETLTQIIQTVQACGFEIVDLDEAARRLREKDPRRFACLTFDDGYRDNAELAQPICAAQGVPMATYVTTGFIEGSDPIWSHGLEALIERCDEIVLRGADQERRLPCRSPAEMHRSFEDIAQLLQRATRERRTEIYSQLHADHGVDIAAMSNELAMSWEQLEEFSKRPGVTIGGHTVSHPALAALERSEALAEIEDCRQLLAARLARPIRHVAYPYGDPTTTGKREFEICQELGVETATTTRHGLVPWAGKPDFHALPRIPTDPFESADTMAVKLSGLPASLQGLRQRVRGRTA